VSIFITKLKQNNLNIEDDIIGRLPKMAGNDQNVILKCIKEGSKLRIRIISPGYNQQANCRFPRDLRVEGQYYLVNPRSIKMITTRGKYYYAIKDNVFIQVQQEKDLPKLPPVKVKVYEDVEQEECCVCFDAPKQSVFVPCGHFYTCHACSSRCVSCPICRVKVELHIDKNDMD
jgi:hypothetical protein